MRRLISFRTIATALLLAPALAGCDGGGGPIDVGDRLSVDTEGRVERGSVLRVTVRRNGAEVAPGEYQLTVSPAAAAQVTGAEVKLLQSGAVTLSATMPGGLGAKELQVAAPPVVVFDRLLGGNRDIWRVALDGQELARLTDDPGDDQDPTVAAGKVVFVSYRAGNGELFSVPLSGGANTRLTNTLKNETAPSLSKDGTRLAYTFDGSGITKVWTAQANGSGAAKATPESFGSDFSIEASPSWAPSGDRLALVSTYDGTADVYDFSLSGTVAMIVGGRSTAEVEPAWSPDGQSVAFATNRDGNTELYLQRLGGTPQRLTTRDGTDALPAWTADGRIVYVAVEGGVARLRWMDPANPAATYPIDTGDGSATRPAVAQ